MTRGGKGQRSPSPGWSVTLGACVTSGRCIQSPNYPGSYRRDQTCTIQVSPDNTLPLEVRHFQTEYRYDQLTINGARYSGSSSGAGNPPPDGLTPTCDIEWESDYSIQDSGWEICLSGSDGTTTTTGTIMGTTMGTTIGTTMGTTIGTTMGSTIGTTGGTATGPSMGTTMGTTMGTSMD